jgi:hypothetical protein
MNPRAKEKKLQRRIVSALARHAYSARPEEIARELGIDRSRVHSALDTMDRFIIGKHRNGYFHHRGGILSYSLHRDRMSPEALEGLRKRK